MIKVLFENHHLYYLPNFIPIISEMNRRGEYEIHASIPATMPEEEKAIFYKSCNELNIQTISNDDETKRNQSIKDSAYDVVVVGNVGQLNQIVNDKTLTVMVYHGIGLKQSYYNDIDPRIDLRSVESESRMSELKAHGHQNLVLTGFTKCDPLLTLDLEMKLGSLGLNHNQKTVLYAPSFYPTSIDQFLPILGKLSYETNIIIKLHNFSWYQNQYAYQSEAVSKLDSAFENIYLVPHKDYNIIPYYGVSDLLVSDISSTMFEYLYLNKPIIMAECFSLRLKHRLFQKRFLKKIDQERMEAVDFAFRLDNAEDLPSLVYHGLEYPMDLENERLAAQTQYLYRVDGKASSRLVDAIAEKLLEGHP